MSRHLNAIYAIEVLHGKLNCSSDKVETRKYEYDNVSYVKKVDGRGVVSAPCQKHNIQRYMENVENLQMGKRLKVGSKITISADPIRYINEDIFGFMRADSISISEEEFDKLDEDEKALFTKDGKKGYKQNITKKRKSRFQLSPLLNVSNRKINLEWNICSTESDSMPYVNEVYSGMFSGICNMNIDEIAKFKISDISSEYRDYAMEEGRTEDELEISNEEKFKRVEAALRGLQHLSIEGNQNNYLTDTSPKFIILAEYSWGNNVFQGIIKERGIDVEALKETLEDNEEFRKSDIYIGLSSRILDKNYADLKDKLNEELKDYEYIKIGTIKQAFDGYLCYLEKTI